MREGGVSVERVEHTGRLLCFQGWTIDASLIHDAGFVENIAFAKLILKRPAYLGRDNQPDLSENNPSFHSFTSFFFFVLSFFAPFLSFFFPFLTTVFLSFFLSSHLSFTRCFLSSLCSVGLTCTSLTAASANRDRHCLSTHPTDEAAFPFLLEYLYKFIGGCLY